MGDEPRKGKEKTNPDLFVKSARGVAWLFLNRVFVQILTLVKLFILARLLLPRDFGVVGLALLTMHILTNFTETGFDYVLVQQRGRIDREMNVAWTFRTIRGAVLFGLLFLLAPYVALFFDRGPELEPDQIKNPHGLIMQLQSQRSPLSGHLYGNLPEPLQRKIALYEDRRDLSDALRVELAGELDRLLRTERLDEPALLKGVSLSGLSRQLIKRRQGGEDMQHLVNRAVLEDAYPGAIESVVLDRGQITMIIRVLGVGLLLTGLSNIGTVLFSRELQYEKQALLQGISTLVNFATTLSLAAVYRSPWALVWGHVFSGIAGVVSSYLVHPYRPRFSLDWVRARRMWRYGRWYLLSRIFNFLLTEGDDLFLSKVLGITALGYYTMAYRISTMPITEISNVMRITFPAYSAIQGDLDRLRLAYYKVLQVIVFVTVPVTALMLVLAPHIVLLFLGPDWQPVVVPLQVLAAWGMIRAIGNNSGSLFGALGRPQVTVQMQLAKLVLLAILIYPLTVRYRIAGTAAAVFISSLLMQFPVGYKLMRATGGRVRDYLPILLSPMVAALTSVGSVLWLRTIFAEITLVNLVVLGGTGAGVYLAVVAAVDRMSGGQNYAILREAAGRLRQSGLR